MNMHRKFLRSIHTHQLSFFLFLLVNFFTVLIARVYLWFLHKNDFFCSSHDQVATVIAVLKVIPSSWMDNMQQRSRIRSGNLIFSYASKT